MVRGDAVQRGNMSPWRRYSQEMNVRESKLIMRYYLIHYTSRW